MKPERMNAFTDGVVAILITILVLELRPPAGHQLSDILDEKSRLLAYVLSFVFVAIYWVNHHHLMQVVYRIDGRTLWANIHLLFWLSLTPIATAWLGQSGVESGPVAAYAIVLLGCAIAYTLLTLALLAPAGEEVPLEHLRELELSRRGLLEPLLGAGMSLDLGHDARLRFMPYSEKENKALTTNTITCAAGQPRETRSTASGSGRCRG